MCATARRPLPAAALQFPTRPRFGGCVVQAPSARPQVESNIRKMKKPIPQDFWIELKAEGGGETYTDALETLRSAMAAMGCGLINP